MENDIITVMFVRQGGKIRSVKLEIKKLFFLAVGVISLIIAFAGLLYGYYSIYRENNNLVAMVEDSDHYKDQAVSTEVTDDKKNSEEGVVREVTEDKKEIETEKEVKESQARLVENLNGRLEESFSVDSNSPQKVRIEDFQIEKSDKNQGVKVLFKIFNVNQTSKIIGFWVLVSENKKKNTVVYRSYPKNVLNENGKLLNSMRANPSIITWFSIERFKPVRGVFEFDNEFTDYDAIYIDVYSNKGELLLRSKYNRWIITA